MRRVLALLVCATLCLALCACAGMAPSAQPAEPDKPAARPAEPLVFDTLGVEFSVDGRDVDMLLALQAEFPQALIDALHAQSVEVGGVSVTFGTSGEATESALQSGAIQIAFLSAEDYFAFHSGMVVATEARETPELSQGLIVCAVSSDASADERFAEALRAALPDLTEVLAPYTAESAAGVYRYDTSELETLGREYDNVL